ncbi:L,D-transpeptidase family protein [Amycolatopsis sp. DG1A-15b]|uniref:L,D-transpeptidase family protein n=1 Tax=Amycolatopsis sp. DG1A-15b TaxID=3052846 RepID=UPI00255BE381|nr:L,D-transpeptidase family protein [Amycolatopsis sp. DG1A-15b]WIX91210.1 L,D-transpeptidase family protein [Amycolatopsis sp. DG1A-15b]
MVEFDTDRHPERPGGTVPRSEHDTVGVRGEGTRSAPATPAALLTMQQSAGNATVAALLHPAATSVQRRDGAGVEESPPQPLLRQGSVGPSVAEAQAKLNRAGTRLPLAEDGIFGPKTRAAVVAFQAGRGISADGIVGPRTRTALDAGNVVPPSPPPGPLDCGCTADDEDADVLELTPGAVQDIPVASVQTLPDGRAGTMFVQREPAKKKAPAKKRTPTPLPAKCSKNARACFSISGRRAWLIKPGGTVQTDVPALGGRKSNPTPQGTFKVIDKDADHVSHSYKDPKTGKPAPMPNYVHFGPLLGFHAGSLTHESHGCVHLSAGAAKLFFDNLQKGDQVDVAP